MYTQWLSIVTISLPKSSRSSVKKKEADNLKLIDKFWFDGSRDKTILNDLKCSVHEFWKLFHKYDIADERANYTKAYDDVLPVLKKLKNRGLKLAITTGAPKGIAEMELKLLPRRLFELIISVTSTRYRNKPDPESLLATLRRTKIKNNEAVYIGNSNDDYLYAKRAHVNFIYCQRREHNFAGKYIYKINSLFDLLQS